MSGATRTERFAKYREEIKNTPDDKFAAPHTGKLLNADKSSLLVADKPSYAITYGDSLSALSDIAHPSSGDGKSPYQHYLSKKRKKLLFKIILFAIALAGMGVWAYLLFGRGM